MNGRTSENGTQAETSDCGKPVPRNWRFAATAMVSAVLLWVSQPPFAIWPMALVALVPLLCRIIDANPPSRGNYFSLWLLATLFWLVTLQGLRHAHPVMYLCWMALAGYLGLYWVLFVLLCRRMLVRGVPLWLAAPITWVGGECLRNYLLTGISAAMLGHTMADVPEMIQIADIFGTYGVSFVLVSINVAILMAIAVARKQTTARQAIPAWAIAITLVIATIAYGRFRLNEPAGPPLATFALIQRDEAVEYGQDVSREVEIFQNYAQQSLEALRAAGEKVDVVVWPESMFAGGSPWMIADRDAKVPDAFHLKPEAFQEKITEHRKLYLERASYIQTVLAAAQDAPLAPPHLIVGCGVVHFAQVPQVYSGVVHIAANGSLDDWYGKTHLVMFGEYVPIVPHIPWLRSLVPPELGLRRGDGAKRFMVGKTAVSPNICIETAVERVTVDQLADLHDRDQMADVVVTVTNDGWFDHSSVIAHHLRCAQLVAVGCRRPLLSAANSGPTAWIDNRGQLIEHLATGTDGAIIATPRRDDRISVYLRIGDWPARFLALLCVVALLDGVVCRCRNRNRPNSS